MTKKVQEIRKKRSFTFSSASSIDQTVLTAHVRHGPEQEDAGYEAAESSPDIDSTNVSPLSNFSTIDTSDAEPISLEQDHAEDMASQYPPSSSIVEAHGLGITVGGSVGFTYQPYPEEELLFAASGSLSGYSSAQQRSLASSQFTFPDLLRSNLIETSEATRADALLTHPALRTSSSQNIIEDETGTELCGSPRRKRVGGSQGTDKDREAGESARAPSFLPLLDHTSGIQQSPGTDGVRGEQASSTQSRLDDLQSQLADLNERLAQIAVKSNDGSEKPANNGPTGKHTEQLQSPSSDQNSQLAAMQDQINVLTENLGRSHQHHTRDSRRLHTAIDSQQDNFDRLSRGWEGIRREVFDLKTSHQQLREQLSKHRQTPSNRLSKPPDLSPRPLLGEAYPPPTSTPIKKPRSSNPPDEFTWYPGKKEPSLTSLISRMFPGAAPAEEQRAATEAARQPITFTRHPVPPPVAGPSFDGSPPDQYRETAEFRAKHRVEYPRGCSWPGCEFCREQGRRRD